MAFPFSLLLTWLGAALLWVAFHGTGATTPWGVYEEILGKGAPIPATTGGTGSDAQTPPANSDPASKAALTDPKTGVLSTGNLLSGAGHLLGTLFGGGSDLPPGSGGVFYPNGGGQ